MEGDVHGFVPLYIVSEKSLQQKCKAQTLSYCPSMDLVALVAKDEQIQVFRLNGQRVFGTSHAYSDSAIIDLKWKPNGHLIAVAGNDNIIRLFSARSGKSVHQFHGPGAVGAQICCLAWAVNFADSRTIHGQILNSNGELSLDNLLTPTQQLGNLKYFKTDLPRQLALLDIEGSLPKLSTLPPTGDENDVFSSRASIDSIFHSNRLSSEDSVDVLFAGFDNGNLHIRIFDCFDIGVVDVRKSFSFDGECKILRHASHPLTSTHCMAVARSARQASEINLLTVDLRFIFNCGRFLALLASKSTQLLNLLRYIGQIQAHIIQEWKTSQDLPTKFMRNVNEDLEEKHHCDFVTAAYHLLVTGDCSDTMKEFLVDQVGDRGYKRWEKAVLTGYENIRRLAHECLLPALERCGVLLSRLLGLAKFQNSSQLLGLEPTEITDCLALVDCLNILGHQLLIRSGQELRQFVCFAKWLRQEIDIQSLEVTSSADEAAERSDNLDYAQVLDYVRGALTKSALLKYFRIVSVENKPTLSTSNGSGLSIYSEYKEALERGKVKNSLDDPGSIKLNDLTANLNARCQKVFGQIAETQKRSILVSPRLAFLDDCDPANVDMIMCQEDQNSLSDFAVYSIMKSQNSSGKVLLHRAELHITNGVSSLAGASAATLVFLDADVKDFKFVDDDDLLILLSYCGRSYLVRLKFRAGADDSNIKYSPLGQEEKIRSKLSQIPEIDIDLANQQVCQLHVRHIFPQNVNRVPFKMEVNGRKGRRVVCILYEDQLHYTVFDLDSGAIDEEEGAEEDLGQPEVEMADAD